MPATELRVHLGEALKALETEDLLIEKGGVPVALLSSYQGQAEQEVDEMRPEYERSLSKRAEPNGIARTLAAMERGWVGIDADELSANIERWREAGARTTRPALDDEDEDEGPDGGEVSSGQQHLYRFAPPETT